MKMRKLLIVDIDKERVIYIFFIILIYTLPLLSRNVQIRIESDYLVSKFRSNICT